MKTVGGVEGVLARHADGVLAGLPDPRPVRALCLRLVTAEGTRRLMERDALLDGLDPVAADALDRLIEARLVSARRIDGRVEVELAHESLITQWDRLRRWIDADRDELAALAEVESAAHLWQRRGRRPTELWDGDALREARRVIERVAEPPSAVRAFVEAGERRVARLRRRRRAVFGGLLLTLTAVVLALSGLNRQAEVARADAQARAMEASKERAEARAQARRARTQEAAALRASARAAHGAGRPLEARARMRAAMELEDHPSGRALWQLITRSPLLWRQDIDAYVFGATVSPEGRFAAVAAIDGILRIFDMHDGSEKRYTGFGGGVVDVHWPAPGRLYVGGSNGLWLLDPTTEARARFEATADALVGGIAELANGELVFTMDRTLKRCRPPCAAPTTVGEMPLRALDAVASPDRSRAVVMAGQGFTRVIDAGGEGWAAIGGEPVPTRRPTAFVDETSLLVARSPLAVALSVIPLVDGRPGGPQPIWDAAMRAHGIDAKQVACGPRCAMLAVGDNRGRVWYGPRDGEPRLLGAHRRHVAALAFTAEGALFSAGGEGELRLWRIPPPPGADRIEPADDGGPLVVRTAADGRIATVSGRWVTLWSAQGMPRGRWLADDRLSMWGAAPIPGSERLVAWSGRRWYLSEPGGERLIRATPDAPTRPRPPLAALFAAFDQLHMVDADGAFVQRALVDADGRPLGMGKLLAAEGDAVLVGDGRRVGLWRGRQSAPRWMVTPSTAPVEGAIFGDDGRVIVVTNDLNADGDVVELDASSGAVTRRLGPMPSGVSGIARLGRRVYALTNEGVLHAWDAAGQHRARPVHRAVSYDLAASADGRSLLSIAEDGVLRAWDPELRPLWRGVGVVADAEDEAGPWLASHHGWQGGSETPPWAEAPWARAMAEGLDAVVGPTVACVITADGAWVRHLRGTARADRFDELPPVAGLDRPSLARSGEICLLRRGGSILLWPPEARAPRSLALDPPLSSLPPGALEGPVVGLSDGFALVDGGRLLLLAPDGQVRGAWTAPTGVTALTRLSRGDWIFGFADGRVERHAPDATGQPRRGDRLTGRATAPVTALGEAPLDTVVVGHLDGTAALWNLVDRLVLREERLHGAVAHIARVGPRMIIASELGDHVRWSMAGLLDAHCAVMRAMWAETHAVWRAGGAVKTEPPAEHRCAELDGQVGGVSPTP